MRRMPSRTLALMLAAVVVASLTACGGGGGSDTGTPSSSEPYKIGAILSLTGTYAGLGAPEKNTIEMEVKRINDAGGINGRDLEVLIEDDATDEAKAVAAAAKLIEQDGVIAILGATGTGQSMAIRGDVDRAGIPQISMAGGTAITANFDSLVYQTPWSNTIVVPFVMNKIKADGYTKVGLISDSGGYGKDGRDVILKTAKELGIDIVSDQTFNAGDTDMSAQLTNIKKANARGDPHVDGRQGSRDHRPEQGATRHHASLVRGIGAGAQGVPDRCWCSGRRIRLRHREESRAVDVGRGQRRVHRRERLREPLQGRIRRRSRHLRRPRVRRDEHPRRRP